jgi:uncharacterized protein (DUF1800 family)
MPGLAGAFEFDAIRPHVLGRFGDMLNAVERHPAMLIYLDQARSMGGNSMVASALRGRRPVGLNENLAREILELHTLGARSGYTQADVTELARAMTGWTVAAVASGSTRKLTGTDGLPDSFVFSDRLHEPGARTILGKTYPATGERQAQAVLDDLSVHPATARHIGTKLARHFAGDDPPPALVARLETAFVRGGGDLPSVYRALIESPEPWVPQPVKFKTPWEWSLSALRALDVDTVPAELLVVLQRELGQNIWRPETPAGFDDIAASWAAPDALMRRVEAAQRMAQRAGGGTDARAAAAALFPGSLSQATAQAIARAESPSQAVALLLVSPEMLRR